MKISEEYLNLRIHFFVFIEVTQGPNSTSYANVYA